MKSKTALVALLSGLVGLLALVGGPLLAMLGVLPPLGAFLLFVAGAILGGLLAFVCGVIGLIRTRPSTERGGARQAMAGTAIGAVLLGLIILLMPGGDVPAIHDITTNTNDAPAFVAIPEVAGAPGDDWSYPQGPEDTAQQQREAYPDLAPIQLTYSLTEALERCRQAAEALGWEVVENDPENGRLEAWDTSRLFRFVDDVAVRVRPSETGSVVDVRSKSRVGQSDLGANAERIRAFRDQLQKP